MKNVVAVVVGVDRYDQQGWSVDGPCANALAVVDWLLDTAIADPNNIMLFVDPRDAQFDSQLESLEQRGLDVQRSAKFSAIDDLWRATLRHKQQPNTKLFMYWSGHGFTDDDGSRIFVCRDYQSPNLRNRVYNSTNVLRWLRSSDYQGFSEQIFLADVCAVKANVLIAADKEPPQTFVATTRQLGFYATPEGEYARGDDGRGVFTQITLDVLAQFNAWPPLTELREAMEVAFKQVGQAIFRVSYRENEAEATELRVGALPAHARGTLFASVFDLLSNIDVPESVYRRCFTHTFNDLGEPALAAAQGLSGMVQELASLRDAVNSRQGSYGLLQFLLRLRSETNMTAPIDAWLQEHAAGQAHMLATLRQKLEEEAATKILIVEVNNEDERIVSYELSVRTSSLAPAPGSVCLDREVSDWEDFAAKLKQDIESLRVEHAVEDFQIQFLANPPLFDRKFHAIALAAGGALGEERIVLLRHKDRVRTMSRVVKDAWRRYADAVRMCKPGELQLVPIAAGATSRPAKEGLCYTSFLVPASVAGSHLGRIEKETLGRLLRTGVAYIYWLHELPAPDGFDCIEQRFAGWLQNAQTIDELPLRFTQQRLNGDPYACEATLLWDDPLFNPFSHTQGVQRT